MITNFVLRNETGGDDFSTGTVSFPYSGILATDSATEISQSDPVQAGLPTDVYDLGNILTAGMDLASLDAFLTRRTYVGELGSGQRQGVQFESGRLTISAER